MVLSCCWLQWCYRLSAAGMELCLDDEQHLTNPELYSTMVCCGFGRNPVSRSNTTALHSCSGWNTNCGVQTAGYHSSTSCCMRVGCCCSGFYESLNFPRCGSRRPYSRSSVEWNQWPGFRNSKMHCPEYSIRSALTYLNYDQQKGRLSILQRWVSS